MNLELVDIAQLGAALLTVSAVVMVLVDLLKLGIKPLAESKDLKYGVSIIIAVIITLVCGISIFESDNQVVFYVGAVLAGYIASLGSNFIHEIMKVLQTVKELKDSGIKKK